MYAFHYEIPTHEKKYKRPHVSLSMGEETFNAEIICPINSRIRWFNRKSTCKRYTVHRFKWELRDVETLLMRLGPTLKTVGATKSA